MWQNACTLLDIAILLCFFDGPPKSEHVLILRYIYINQGSTAMIQSAKCTSLIHALGSLAERSRP